MKKLSALLGISLLSAVLIVPGVSRAQGWGMGGGHMMGYGGGDPGYYDQDDGGYATLTGQQQKRLADLDRKFYYDTRELRDSLWEKSVELDALPADKNPETGKASNLQKEISDLQAKLDEKAINHEIEARKIAPDIRFGGSYGYGHMMGGSGRGYGPGGC